MLDWSNGGKLKLGSTHVGKVAIYMVFGFPWQELGSHCMASDRGVT